VIASSLSVLLVAGVGVAGAWVWNGWGATLPEDVLPSSSIAFARIDLSPGLGQQMKLKSLADKFPATDGRDPVDRVVEGILSGIGLEPLTPADIEPWFDRRLGVALWSSDGTMPKACTLLALASKDEGKATAALQRVKHAGRPGAFGFAHSHGYAITAKCQVKDLDSQAVVAAAIAAAGQQSLGSAADFTAATDRLGSGQLAIAYADLNAASGLFGGRPDMPAYTGHFVAGLQLAGGGVELRFRATADKGQGEVSAALAKLGELPGGSAAGLSLDLHSLASEFASLSETTLPSLIDQLSTSGPGITVSEMPPCWDDLAPDATDAEIFACLEQQGTTLVPATPETTPESDTTAILDTIGSLIASPLTFAVGSLGDEPTFWLSMSAATAKDAEAVSDLFKSLDSNAPTVTTSGTTVTARSADFPAGSGTLADNPRYRAALADAPANSYLAMYADVEKLAAGAKDSKTAWAKPIKAIGGAFGIEGGETVGLIRVIIE
jgi:hypothetical protein